MGRSVFCSTLLLVAALHLTNIFAVAAQENASFESSLTLEQAISTALVQNPQIAAEKSGLSASAEKIVQARSGLLPQVNFLQSYQRTNNPMWSFGAKLKQGRFGQEDFALDALNDPSSIDNFTSAFLVSWSLFDSGQTWYGLRQADLANRAQEMVLELARQEVIARTVEAYSRLVLSRENLTVVDQALETARAHLLMIEERYKNGLTVKSDVLRAQVHIAELDQERVVAASAVTVAMAALNTAMGVSTGQTIAPVDPLARRDLPEKTLEEWVLLSLEKRPDLLMLDFQEQVASAEVKKARAANLPSVNVNGSYEINSEDLGDSADNYTVGADLSLNLFSGYRFSSRRQEALFRQQAAKDYQRAMRQQAELEVRQAYYDILSAAKRIRAAEISVDQADEALRIVGDRYKTGLLPLVSLLDAEVALYRAKNNHNRALYQHVMARTQLAQAAGILDKDFVLCAENHH